MDEIVAFLTQEAEAVRENEPGALRFDVWRDPCDENSVIVCECYIDEDAFEKHKEGQFYRRFDTHVVPDMASQVEIVPFADGFALEAQLIEQRPQPLNDGTRQILLGVYQELCRSHHAITDFRARLLALLPLATGAGAFVLFRDEGLQEWTLPIGLSAR